MSEREEQLRDLLQERVNEIAAEHFPDLPAPRVSKRDTRSDPQAPRDGDVKPRTTRTRP